MGFLSGIKDTLFGGSDDSGIEAQQKSNERSQAYIEAQSKLARGDANSLYAQGDYARNLGINMAMALMGRSLPQQMGMFQGGNMAAQNQYIQGQPMYQNDILGIPNNQPTQSPYRAALPDPGSYQMQLPNFGQTWNVGAAGTASPQQSQPDPYAMLAQLLGGAR